MNHSCLFFSILGALVLSEHHRIDAKVYVGFAALRLSQDGEVLLRGTETPECGSNENAFHSWVETEDWCVDFSAPVISDICKERDIPGNHKRRVFLKKITQMAETREEMRSEGAFMLGCNDDLTRSMVHDFFAERQRKDIAEFMCRWYRRPPEKMADVVKTDSMGLVRYVRHKLDGEW